LTAVKSALAARASLARIDSREKERAMDCAPHETLEGFFAAALAIEREAQQRYAELAELMGLRGYRATAAQFEHLRRLEADAARRIEWAAPEVNPLDAPRPVHRWDMTLVGDWGDPLERARVTPIKALVLALKNEWIAQEYYESVARSSPSEAVRRFAAEYAADEADHVAYVESAIESAERDPPAIEVEDDALDASD
jgi:rubrerythrin